MSEIRIWHASRDAYHCAFRILRLLVAAADKIELERLRILDMYLLFPALLHRASMPRSVKNAFGTIDVEKPDEKFIRLPSSASVFQDLRLYQNSAVGQLAARNLLDPGALKKGAAVLTPDSMPLDLLARVQSKNAADQSLISFLLGPFATQPLRGTESIYKRSGLPTRVITE